MTKPYLAPSLVRACQQIGERWKHADTSSDGWIGNAAHQATTSDHNPDDKGCVHAIDRGTHGRHLPTLLAGLIAGPPTRYVIHRRRIWQAADRFWPRTYKGKNPHTGHVHESIFHVLSCEQWAGHWSPITGWLDSVNLSQGATGQEVMVVQAYLLAYWYALRADGVFGPETERLVRAFQKRSGIRVDGIVGPQTRRAFETGWL
jgi:hypothetical protein